MKYFLYKIKSWQLPRVLLFSFSGVFVFLSGFTLQEALNPDKIESRDALILKGEIRNFRRTFFKSSLLLTFRIEGYCSELTTPGFLPFHYKQFKKDYTVGLPVTFTIRKSDLIRLDSCLPCEIVAFKSANASYLTLSERNQSSYTAKRIVAGGITATLLLAGLITLALALLSDKDSADRREYWERRTVFRRKPF